jgi:hypothetical protein
MGHARVIGFKSALLSLRVTDAAALSRPDKFAKAPFAAYEAAMSISTIVCARDALSLAVVMTGSDLGRGPSARNAGPGAAALLGAGFGCSRRLGDQGHAIACRGALHGLGGWSRKSSGPAWVPQAFPSSLPAPRARAPDRSDRGEIC